LVAGRAIAAELAAIRRTDYSDNCLVATQRRYPMQQRSPLIFWLLLAATISLDLAVFSWSRFFPRSDKCELVVLALAFGQMSALCIWLVFCPRPGAYRWLIGGAALAAAVLGIYRSEPAIGIVESATLIGFHAAAVLVAIWLQKIAAAHRRQFSTGAQFSIKSLFVLTTATAVLAALVGSSETVRQEWAFTIFFIFSNVTLAVGCLLLWNRNWPPIWRLAAALAPALVVGWCLSLAKPHLSGDCEVLCCVQVIVIFAWLQFGEIIPCRGQGTAGDTQIATN
jgi:hypothetical protein